MRTTEQTRNVGVTLNNKHYTVFVAADGSVVRITTCSAGRFTIIDTTGRTGRAVIARMRAA